MTQMERLRRCLAELRTHTNFVPDVALVLGSGLGAFAETVTDAVSVGYGALSGFPVSTVPGHEGRFVFGTVNGVKVAVMQGRVHYYEGYSLDEVVLPVRLMALLGARALFLTNASGGVNPAYGAGDFMLIRDHVSLFFPNPLVGPNPDELGTRFPDMSEVYDTALSDAVCAAGRALGIPLREGVYAQVSGPSFETPAEIRLLGRLGVDAVGMSTACEATAARHAGLRVCGLSCVANMAAGLAKAPLTHEEVQAAAHKGSACFQTLLFESLPRIAALL